MAAYEAEALFNQIKRSKDNGGLTRRWHLQEQSFESMSRASSVVHVTLISQGQREGLCAWQALCAVSSCRGVLQRLLSYLLYPAKKYRRLSEEC